MRVISNEWKKKHRVKNIFKHTISARAHYSTFALVRIRLKPLLIFIYTHTNPKWPTLREICAIGRILPDIEKYKYVKLNLFFAIEWNMQIESKQHPKNWHNFTQLTISIGEVRSFCMVCVIVDSSSFATATEDKGKRRPQFCQHNIF